MFKLHAVSISSKYWNLTFADMARVSFGYLFLAMYFLKLKMALNTTWYIQETVNTLNNKEGFPFSFFD